MTQMRSVAMFLNALDKMRRQEENNSFSSLRNKLLFLSSRPPPPHLPHPSIHILFVFTIATIIDRNSTGSFSKVVQTFPLPLLLRNRSSNHLC
ncbi:hypothetical protein HZH68_003550 [Vespula germanica]|uniref:Uncharacterized protein n=1 Tax=Vespula germanica TaxID=30212 RepID=A0A834U3D1_VESGE|nr:hypothetical protein HZH68_003550 [Vespula germanica]